MADGSLWVGKDEAEGIPVEPRKDVQPPPHWRLEAVAATERPRSLAVSDDRRSAVFIQDRDTSDVWLLAHGDPTPRRLTTGRDPMPYWEDTQPRISPDGSRSRTATRGTCGSCRPPAARRASCSRRPRRCGSTTRR